MGRLQPLLKTSGVVIGAILLSTLGLRASDQVSGLLPQFAGTGFFTSAPCPSDMVPLDGGQQLVCVDRYEATPGSACPHPTPTSEVQTIANVTEPECEPVSQPKAEPWRYVNLSQAQQLCARVGKRIPTNQEWHAAALGVAAPDQCVLYSEAGPRPSGTSECITASGVSDLVGNVWEWTAETVREGVFTGQSLPSSGYVAMVDENGVPIKTSTTSVARFGDDYVWVDTTSVTGLLRGGFYGSGSDGGIFAVNAAVTPELQTAGVGFRCVMTSSS